MRILSLLLVALSALGVRAQDFGAVDALVRDSLDQIGGGAVLVVVHEGDVVHRQAYGTFSLDTVVPVASVTKALSGAVIGSLLSDGTLTLDDSLAQFFPTLEGQKRHITIRQLFAHTSGLPGGSGLEAPFCLSNPFTTLGACARSVLDLDLAAAPGSGFAYGGASMHVAGHVAELASGERWVDLFEDRIARPLGLSATTFNGTLNPRIAGGASSSADDIARVFQMLLDDGAYDGQQVLTPEASRALIADQTEGATVLSSPYETYASMYPSLPPVEDIRYGVGLWREAAASDGTAEIASSPGAFGTAPWIDRRADVAAVLLVADRLPDVMGTYLALQQLVREAVTPPVSTSPEASGDRMTVSVQPNPARRWTTVRYVLPGQSAVQVELFNARGRRVAVLAQGVRARGLHRVPLDARDLAPGLYRVVVTTGDRRASQAVVLVR